MLATVDLRRPVLLDTDPAGPDIALCDEGKTQSEVPNHKAPWEQTGPAFSPAWRPCPDRPLSLHSASLRQEDCGGEGRAAGEGHTGSLRLETQGDVRTGLGGGAENCVINPSPDMLAGVRSARRASVTTQSGTGASGQVTGKICAPQAAPNCRRSPSPHYSQVTPSPRGVDSTPMSLAQQYRLLLELLPDDTDDCWSPTVGGGGSSRDPRQAAVHPSPGRPQSADPCVDTCKCPSTPPRTPPPCMPLAVDYVDKWLIGLITEEQLPSFRAESRLAGPDVKDTEPSAETRHDDGEQDDAKKYRGSTKKRGRNDDADRGKTDVQISAEEASHNNDCPSARSFTAKFDLAAETKEVRSWTKKDPKTTNDVGRCGGISLAEMSTGGAFLPNINQESDREADGKFRQPLTKGRNQNKVQFEDRKSSKAVSLRNLVTQFSEPEMTASQSSRVNISPELLLNSNAKGTDVSSAWSEKQDTSDGQGKSDEETEKLEFKIDNLDNHLSCLEQDPKRTITSHREEKEVRKRQEIALERGSKSPMGRAPVMSTDGPTPGMRREPRAVPMSTVCRRRGDKQLSTFQLHFQSPCLSPASCPQEHDSSGYGSQAEVPSSTLESCKPDYHRNGPREVFTKWSCSEVSHGLGTSGKIRTLRQQSDEKTEEAKGDKRSTKKCGSKPRPAQISAIIESGRVPIVFADQRDKSDWGSRGDCLQGLAEDGMGHHADRLRLTSQESRTPHRGTSAASDQASRVLDWSSNCPSSFTTELFASSGRNLTPDARVNRDFPARCLSPFSPHDVDVSDPAMMRQGKPSSVCKVTCEMVAEALTGRQTSVEKLSPIENHTRNRDRDYLADEETFFRDVAGQAISYSPMGCQSTMHSEKLELQSKRRAFSHHHLFGDAKECCVLETDENVEYSKEKIGSRKLAKSSGHFKPKPEKFVSRRGPGAVRRRFLLASSHSRFSALIQATEKKSHAKTKSESFLVIKPDERVSDEASALTLSAQSISLSPRQRMTSPPAQSSPSPSLGDSSGSGTLWARPPLPAPPHCDLDSNALQPFADVAERASYCGSSVIRRQDGGSRGRPNVISSTLPHAEDCVPQTFPRVNRKSIVPWAQNLSSRERGPFEAPTSHWLMLEGRSTHALTSNARVVPTRQGSPCLDMTQGWMTRQATDK